jgi:hypothetical protein
VIQRNVTIRPLDATQWGAFWAHKPMNTVRLRTLVLNRKR